MQITRTHNGYHLGDNLVHLNFLRKVALANPDRQFVHAAQWQYIRQLRDVVSDVPNIKLEEFGYLLPADSLDSWRGSNNFWYQHPNRNDFVNFHLDAWFPYLCERMGVENPMHDAKDMLFDAPTIGNWQRNASYLITTNFRFPFDVLFINSQPGSNQWASFNPYQLGDLANQMHKKGIKVITTDDSQHLPEVPTTVKYNISVCGIGFLSLHCHTILMVSTGPSWPTFNIWNQDTITHRIILLEPERVNLAPNTTHCATIDEAAQVLKGIGLL